MVINLTLNSLCLNFVSNGCLTTIYLVSDNKTWKNVEAITKWMFIPPDIKHKRLHYHWSLWSTKLLLKNKSLSHKINKETEPVMSTMPIKVAMVLNTPVVSDLLLCVPISDLTTKIN